MKPLHKNQSGAQSNSKEGQRRFLCSNKSPHRCPSLVYEQAENPNQAAIDRAYDILFDEIIRIKKLRKINGDKANQVDSNI